MEKDTPIDKVDTKSEKQFDDFLKDATRNKANKSSMDIIVSKVVVKDASLRVLDKERYTIYNVIVYLLNYII